MKLLGNVTVSRRHNKRDGSVVFYLRWRMGDEYKIVNHCKRMWRSGPACRAYALRKETTRARHAAWEHQQLLEGPANEEPPLAGVNVWTALDKWSKHHKERLSAMTLAKYEGILYEFFQWHLAERPEVDEVRNFLVGHVRAYLNHRGRVLKPSTYNGELSALKHFFRWAESWNLILGVGGIFSFAQVALFAIGGITTGALAKHLGWSARASTILLSLKLTSGHDKL